MAFYLSEYKTIQSTTLENALHKVENLFFDLVITDVKLDQNSGMEVLKMIRSLGEETPVILISGYNVDSMPIQALFEGAFSFIEKPFTKEELLHVVELALRKRDH